MSYIFVKSLEMNTTFVNKKNVCCVLGPSNEVDVWICIKRVVASASILHNYMYNHKEKEIYAYQ